MNFLKSEQISIKEEPISQERLIQFFGEDLENVWLNIYFFLAKASDSPLDERAIWSINRMLRRNLPAKDFINYLLTLKTELKDIILCVDEIGEFKFNNLQDLYLLGDKESQTMVETLRLGNYTSAVTEV